MNAGTQGPEPTSTALPGHKHATVWEVEQPGLETKQPLLDAGDVIGLIHHHTCPHHFSKGLIIFIL